FEAPVTLHNDADAGLIGERFYAANPPENMAYLTISTGIGAGVAVDGEVLSGVEGNAAEVGHFVVEPGGLFCGCGGEGHWEAYCAGTSIPQHARSLHESEGIQSNLSLDVAEFGAADVFAAVGEDPLADRTVEACTRYNAIGVANIVHAFAPETIYVGGAVARNNAELVVDPLQERVADRVMTTAPEIRVTSLGDETVVRGALAAAIITATEDRTLAD
ncbi:MAG: ROK family protein, partial [Halolamina sp.]